RLHLDPLDIGVVFASFRGRVLVLAAASLPDSGHRPQRAEVGESVRIHVRGLGEDVGCFHGALSYPSSMPDWLHAPDYWIARLVLQRGLGLIYLIAFAVALEQFPALLGERGLLPVPRYLERARFLDAPSLFYFGYSDRLLRAVSVAGIVLSLAIVTGLPDGWPAPLTIAIWLVLW